MRNNVWVVCGAVWILHIIIKREEPWDPPPPHFKIFCGECPPDPPRNDRFMVALMHHILSASPNEASPICVMTSFGNMQMINFVAFMEIKYQSFCYMLFMLMV